MTHIRASTLALLLSLTACGSEPPPHGSDAGTEWDGAHQDDGGLEPDAGPFDAGIPPDAGPTPDTRIESWPAAYTNSRSAELIFIATVADSTFECALNGAQFEPCASPAGYDGLVEGQQRFQVRAISPGGVVDPTPAERSWIVDITDPVSAITSSPSTEGASEPAAFVFEANEPVSGFECAFDGAPFTPCTSPALALELPVGTHSFEVRATDLAGNVEVTPERHEWSVTAGGPTTIRILAANTTSGNFQSYDLGHGTRIFQGLDPDITLIQEFNFGRGTVDDIRAFVDEAFGANHTYFREPGRQIPNGIVSRFPIIESGVWDDPRVNNREFAWARIDVPGPKDLWAVSVHLLTTSQNERNLEATSLVDYIEANVPAGDFLVIGGDLNTGGRNESALQTLSKVVVTTGPWPADQKGNGGTNANRDKPYDWVLPDTDLAALETPLKIGASTYPNGIVFDSRVYSPLEEVAPVLESDSRAPSMQHMAVGKDFLFTP